jgi:ribosomal protein L37E
MKRAHDYAYAPDSEVSAIRPVLPDADTVYVAVYRPKQTTCLRCGDLFDSYDPRYNRLCAACGRTVQAQDDRYNY